MAIRPVIELRCACLVLVVALAHCASAADFTGGTGEPNDPYGIATAEQLLSIGSDPNLLDKHFVLLNDIDLDPNLPGGRIFSKPLIAPSQQSNLWKGVPFRGTFNGRGHSVRHMTFQKTAVDFIGLFGSIAKGGLVSDLRVEDANVNRQFSVWHGVLAAWNEGRIVRCGATGRLLGNMYVGMLAGFNRGEIIDCWAEGDVSGGDSVGGLVGVNSFGIIVDSHAACKVDITDHRDFNQGGGLVGQNLDGMIVNCWAGGDVFGVWATGQLGGLVGRAAGGLIANSYAMGEVSAEDLCRQVGGLIGTSSATINDCYATGNVSAGDSSSSVGGLVGGRAFITDSYAIGRVSAGQESKDIGGLTGNASYTESEGCFWNVETSGLAESGGGTGLTTAQMQDPATYLAAGWDLAGEAGNGAADLWLIPEGGGYPLLTVHSDKFQTHKLDGAGTSEDPYRIATVEDLDAINHYDLTACYKLEADIDLAQSPRTKSIVRYFDGTFDGAGRLVTGLTIRGADRLGLFGSLGARASISNLGIQDANVTGRSFLGLLASTNRGSITACRVNGTVTGSGNLGLLTGWNHGSIYDSCGTGSVSAGYSRGGLIGWNIGKVSRCYAAVLVSRSSALDTREDIGGLVGRNEEPPWSGVAFAKLLDSVAGEVHDSYFLAEIDGGGPDNALGTPLTQAGTKQQAGFTNWDFENTWTICEDQDYPRLRWENVSCEGQGP